MGHPKKDYELLMRYLQGSAIKKEPASLPEPDFNEAWQQTAQPALASTPTIFVSEKKKLRVPIKLPTLYIPKIPQFSVRKKTRLLIAVLALGAFVFILWKSYSFYQLSTDGIYNDLYVPITYNPPLTKASDKSPIETYFNTSNFVAVTMQSKKQPQLSDGEQLLTGLAYMQRADYGKAIKWLELAANNFKSPYRQQAEFYVALAYLKNEDFDRSIEKLEKIYFNPAHMYHDRVTQGTISDIKMLKWR